MSTIILPLLDCKRQQTHAPFRDSSSQLGVYLRCSYITAKARMHLALYYAMRMAALPLPNADSCATIKTSLNLVSASVRSV